MTRPTHHRDIDHDGFDFDTNIKLDGATTNYADGDGLHTVLSDMDDRIDAGGGGGGGFTPVVMYLERNSNITAGTSPVIFDTFYDVDMNDTSLTFPTGIGLSTANNGDFTHTTDGLWLFYWEVNLQAAPGHTGRISPIYSGTYMFGERIYAAASGNLTTPVSAFTPVYAHNSDTFKWQGVGTGSDILATYMAVHITRIW